MIKKIYPVIFLLICLTAGAAYSQTRKPPLLKFADLQKYDVKNETFRIEGFVFDVYKCPPCPEGAMCKPCIPDNVVIVDKIDMKNPATMKRLRIFTDKPEQFTLKKKYIFTVKVKGKMQAGQPIGDVELIRFENPK